MSSLPPPLPPTPSGPGAEPPPRYVPDQAAHAGPGAAPFRRIGTLAKAMVILLGISAAIQVVLLPVMVSLQGKASDFVDGRIDEEAFRDALNTEQGIQSLQGGVIIAIVVLTMVWMYRLASNHRTLGRPGSTWAPGWAIGGWFVPPGAIYVVPWLMFNELWKGSDPANVPNDPNWRSRKVSPITTIWWILYGFVPLIGVGVGFGIGFGNIAEGSIPKLAERLDDFFAIQFTLAAINVVTTAVFAKLVFDLTRRQQVLIGER